MKIKPYVVKAIGWIGITDVGWGNGYAILPRGHPCFEMSYDEIYLKYGDFFHNIPSELTYSGRNIKGVDNTKDVWLVGFDTMHYGDNIINWPEKRVREVADKLVFAFYEIYIMEERAKNKR